MRRIVLLSFLYCLFPILAKSQTCDVWIVTPLEQTLELQANGEMMFINEEYQQLMQTASVSHIFQSFPYSKIEKLKRVYTLRCPILNIDILGNSNLVEDIIELPNDSVELFVPSDAMWNSYYPDSTAWLWHLKKIQADSAWDITQGDAAIKIALLDTWVDPNHPDLANQLEMDYDPYDNLPFYSSGTESNHGTCVASFIAAETVGGGDLAAIGFRCKIIPIKAHAGNYLSRAHFASLSLNADVLTSSAGGWDCNLNFNDIERLAVKEILDNGTVIVMPAGNGLNSHSHCPSVELGRDQPWRPLHPHYDERIIIVSSTDKNDIHYFEKDGIDNTHSHYPEVDICAPGYLTMGAQGTLDATNNPISWPYYGSCIGTSFATPIVAGVCGLIKSLNPCFAPEDVQDIIKNSADPIADADDYPGLVGAGRVNAYQALLLAQSYLRPDTITTSTTWNQKKHIYSDVIIDSLATLTITDTLYIAGGSSIIVRPGGKLIVNGGTLTNACDGEMWQGIIVEGNADIRQGALAQGSVILNNATIENARNAIATMGSDTNAVYEHTGGIVQATNTLFRNNRRSVEFLSYENHTTGGAVTDNVSYFTRCTFTVDNGNLFAANGTSFLEHVSLWHVRGVKFNGCTFRNETGSHSGKAIYTDEAGFTAKRVCPAVMNNPDPCYCEGTLTDTVTRCTFSGFHTAVHAANNNAIYAVTLDNCDFGQNRTGVKLSAADNAQVSFCDFNLSGTSSFCGVELTNSTGYTIESNTLHSEPYTNTPSAIGIMVTHSGTAENVIRKNMFRNLLNGCLAQDINATHPYVKPQYGLQFQCNDFLDCAYDIAVANGRIRNPQGSASAGADNIFRYAIVSSFTLVSAGSFTYWYSNTGYHAPYNPPATGVTLMGTASANSCASTLCGIPLYPRGTAALSQYRAMAEEYAALAAEYEGRESETEEEASSLLDQMSDLSAQMGDLARAEIRDILNDSVPDMALLKEWYSAITAAAPAAGDIPVSAYQLAEVYSEEGDMATARTLLSALPQQFSPDEAARSEYANYMSLQQLRETVAGNWYLMTDSDIAAMQQVAEYDNGRAARMAKEILCFFHHICYEDDPLWDWDGIGERNLGGRMVHRASTITVADGLVIYPNPTGGILTLDSSSPIREITVYDLSGRVMMTVGCGVAVVETCCSASLQQQYALNVSSLHSGIYLLKAVTDSGVQTARFVKN